MIKRLVLMIILIILSLNIVLSEVVTNTRQPLIVVDYGEESIGEISSTNYSLMRNGVVPYDIRLEENQNNVVFTFLPVQNLQNGNYTFTIIARDHVGNERTKSVEFEVNVDFTGIDLYQPKTGVSNMNVFDLIIETSDPVKGCGYSQSSCFYDDLDKVPSNLRFSGTEESGGKTHIIDDFTILKEDVEVKICVICEDSDDVSGTKIFNLMYDTTPANIKVYSTPLKVIEYLKVDLIAESIENNAGKKDLLNCRFDTNPGKDYDDMNYKFYQSDMTYNEKNTISLNDITIPNIADKTTYNFYVKCKNRAGLVSAEQKITFEVDLSAGSAIISKSPEGYINNKQVLLSVETNRGGKCTYKRAGASTINTFSSAYGKLHQASVFLEDGDYSYEVNCDEFTPIGNPVSTQIDFIVDTIKPSSPAINMSPVCSEKIVSATLSSIDNNQIGSFKYWILSGDVNLTRAFSVSTDSNLKSVEIANLNLNRNSSYKFYAQALDKAGNEGDVQNTIFSVLSSDSYDCKEKNPPYLEVYADDLESSTNVRISCIDESGCEKITYYYIMESYDQECSNYISFGEYLTAYNGEFKVYSSGKLCYIAVDGAGNTASGEKQINVNSVAFDDGTDSDLDRMSDVCEEENGFDPNEADENSNNVPDGYEDADNDGLINLDECVMSSKLNQKDTDSDSFFDGAERTSVTNIIDKNEMPLDSDNDGIDDLWEEINCNRDCDPDFDLDNDGLNNYIEYLYNTDPNNKDTDDDGILDNLEINEYYTLVLIKDTDSDGYNDGSEIDAKTNPFDPLDYPVDTDGDGILDYYEELYNLCGMDKNDITDKYEDFDADGLYNYDEFLSATNPCEPDTDGDTFFDGAERTSGTDPLDPDSYPTDSDNDGMDDEWEIKYFGDLLRDGTLDFESDKLSDLREYIYNTNPLNSDTDGDGLYDGDEADLYKTNPLKKDTDADSYDDKAEIDESTDPLDPNSYPLDLINEQDYTSLPADEKSHLLSIILMIIGLLMILSSAGYILYKRSIGASSYRKNILTNIQGTKTISNFYEENNKSADYLTRKPSQRPTEPKNNQNVSASDSMRQRLALQRALLDKKRKEKQEERIKIMQAFSGNDDNINKGDFLKERSVDVKDSELLKKQQIQRSQISNKLMKNIANKDLSNEIKDIDPQIKIKLDKIIENESIFSKLDLLKNKVPDHIAEKLNKLSKQENNTDKLTEFISKNVPKEMIDEIIEKSLKNKRKK